MTAIDSTMSQVDAFAYMADFANALHWDPSVSAAARVGDGAVGLGTAFDLVAGFAGRDVALRYVIEAFESPRLVVLVAEQPRFTSRDTITVEPRPDGAAGSVVRYDARLDFKGFARLFDPVMQLFFNSTGKKADTGMRAALNP